MPQPNNFDPKVAVRGDTADPKQHPIAIALQRQDMSMTCA
jgi:hypothetical protein